MARMLMCSVSPYGYQFQRTYNGNLHIPPCKKGDLFSSVWIEDAQDCKVIYHGISPKEWEKIPYPIPAERIVNDLLHTGNLEREGVWICASGKPTDAEIETAQQRRINWLLACVNEGDKVYARLGTRGLDQIPDYMKRAVAELGETRDWVLTPAARKIQCEGCGTMVSPLGDGKAPAYCPSCKSVMNEERAKLLNERKANVEQPAPLNLPSQKKQAE